MVRLPHLNADAAILGGLLDKGDEIGIRLMPVDLRLANAEKVQIRSIYNQYLHHPITNSQPLTADS